MSATDDVRIEEVRPLLAPRILMDSLPLAEGGADAVSAWRRGAEEIISGEDDRLLVVVGPCSIHSREVALEYGALLAEKVAEHSEDLHLVMRVYFEKPRTTVGWKGHINDPGLDGTFDINRGLESARSLLLELTGMGVPAGTEFLDVITPQYIADLVTWGAIGARTTESQIHRELASGLSVPVGFKNGTDGNIKIAIDAIGAAHGSHHFLSVTKQGVSAIVKTQGNDSCHVILRGANDGPNFGAERVGEVLSELEDNGLPPFLMVDCSHGNSLKDHTRQMGVCSDLASQVAGGQRGITGIMIESNLVAGKQKVAPGEELVHGQSITDACTDWETTTGMLDELAAAVQKRRGVSA